MCEIVEDLDISKERVGNNFVLRIRDAKALRNMGAEFTECRSKANDIPSNVWANSRGISD